MNLLEWLVAKLGHDIAGYIWGYIDNVECISTAQLRCKISCFNVAYTRDAEFYYVRDDGTFGFSGKRTWKRSVSFRYPSEVMRMKRDIRDSLKK